MNAIYPATKVPRHEPQCRANDPTDYNRLKGHAQGNSGTINDAAQHVPPYLIRAQRIGTTPTLLPHGWLEACCQAAFDRVVGRNPLRKKAGNHQEKDQNDHRHPREPSDLKHATQQPERGQVPGDLLWYCQCHRTRSFLQEVILTFQGY